MSFIKTFDQVIKHNFDQTPVLLENFDQVIRSSAIRSSDPLSIVFVQCIRVYVYLKSTIVTSLKRINFYNNL